MATDIVHDFLRIAQPVEIAPDFTTVHRLGTLVARQFADRLEDRHHYGDVRVMFVGRIVRVNNSGVRGREDRDQIFLQTRILRVLHHVAPVIELNHRCVAPHDRRVPLLFAAHLHHFIVGELRIPSATRTARTIRAGNATEPFRLAVVARVGRDDRLIRA